MSAIQDLLSSLAGSDPADRAIMIKDGLDSNPLDTAKRNPLYDSFYKMHLGRWLRFFPAENFLLLRSELVAKKLISGGGERVIADMLEFLGVQSTINPELSKAIKELVRACMLCGPSRFVIIACINTLARLYALIMITQTQESSSFDAFTDFRFLNKENMGLEESSAFKLRMGIAKERMKEFYDNFNVGLYGLVRDAGLDRSLNPLPAMWKF